MFILVLYSKLTPFSYERVQTETRKRHLALVFKGLHALQHFIVELKHIRTPTTLLARPGVVSVTIMLTLEYLHIYALYLCFTPASPLWMYVTAVILLHLHICI